ncbi:12305_t:CDS:2 [Acaulospora morrowiae]|uniref:12305_t:CDS:1 n=1 Tax=Acaulospora morrowiae TaxID=94023 RepID=A0A9N8V406_9GLOM|nr:12305_t:CDS:2 [Acaulospora morrowiae]
MAQSSLLLTTTYILFLLTITITAITDKTVSNNGVVVTFIDSPTDSPTDSLTDSTSTLSPNSLTTLSSSINSPVPSSDDDDDSETLLSTTVLSSSDGQTSSLPSHSFYSSPQPSSSSQPSSNSSRSFSGQFLTDLKNATGFHVVVAIAYLVIFLNCSGCIYIFYRSWMQWKLSTKSLSMIFRLPFYTAVSDSGIAVIGAIDIYQTSANAIAWSQPTCGVLGALNYLFISLNLTLYSAISITTYLRVCREIYIDLGKYDYKLWLMVFLFSGIFQLIVDQKYWCSTRYDSSFVLTFLFILISIILILVISCCILILRTLLDAARNNVYRPRDQQSNNHNSGNSNFYGRNLRNFFRCNCNFNVRGIVNIRRFRKSINTNNQRRRHSEISRRRSELEKRALNKVLGYLLVFIIQWLPVQIYALTKIFQVHSSWLYIICVVGMHSGGTGNAITYVMNEGWKPHETPSSRWATTNDSPSSKNVNPLPPSSPYHNQSEHSLSHSAPQAIFHPQDDSGIGAGVVESVKQPQEIHIDPCQQKPDSHQLDLRQPSSPAFQFLGNNPHNRRNSQKYRHSSSRLLIQEVVTNMLNNGNNINPGFSNINDVENSYNNNVKTKKSHDDYHANNSRGNSIYTVNRNDNVDNKHCTGDGTDHLNNAHESSLSIFVDAYEKIVSSLTDNEIDIFNSDVDLEYDEKE